MPPGIHNGLITSFFYTLGASPSFKPSPFSLSPASCLSSNQRAHAALQCTSHAHPHPQTTQSSRIRLHTRLCFLHTTNHGFFFMYHIFYLSNTEKRPTAAIIQQYQLCQYTCTGRQQLSRQEANQSTTLRFHEAYVVTNRVIRYKLNYSIMTYCKRFRFIYKELQQ